MAIERDSFKPNIHRFVSTALNTNKQMKQALRESDLSFGAQVKSFSAKPQRDQRSGAAPAAAAEQGSSESSE